MIFFLIPAHPNYIIRTRDSVKAYIKSYKMVSFMLEFWWEKNVMFKALSVWNMWYYSDIYAVLHYYLNITVTSLNFRIFSANREWDSVYSSTRGCADIYWWFKWWPSWFTLCVLCKLFNMLFNWFISNNFFTLISNQIYIYLHITEHEDNYIYCIGISSHMRFVGLLEH